MVENKIESVTDEAGIKRAEMIADMERAYRPQCPNCNLITTEGDLVTVIDGGTINYGNYTQHLRTGIYQCMNCKKVWAVDYWKLLEEGK